MDNKDWLNCLENRNKDVAEEYAEWHDEIVREEVINSLWHDYAELPDFKQPIIYTFKCGFNSIQSLNCPNKESFNAIFKVWGEFKWAYSKDVLPKEYSKI